MAKLFLIPGMGADSRIYKHIYTGDYNVVKVEWFEPSANDTLSSYTQKLVNRYQVSDGDMVIGNSLGGMIAIEIAKIISLKKVILISSIKTITEAPWYFKLFRRVPVYKLLSDKIITSMANVVKPLFGRMSHNDGALLADMLRQSSPGFIRWAMGAALDWNNRVIPPNVYHITGDKDLIFNYKRITNAEIIKGGKHAMIFYRANEINKWLKDVYAL